MKHYEFELLRSALVLVALALAACADPSDAPASQPLPAPPTSRADAATQPVTEENLLANERFWPYRVALKEPLAVAGRESPLPIGFTGVLIRVEDSGLPRVDFGSHGKYEIRAGATDIVERANAIRRGESQKTQPNFVQAIEARLLDSSAQVLQPLLPEASRGRPGFLCVFADPDAQDFEALARSLAPQAERAGALTILFPQGSHSDSAVRERLRSLDWPVAFLPDHLSEPYTRTLGVDGAVRSFVLLQSAEGRVLFQGQAADAPSTLAGLDSAFDSLARVSALAE